MAAASILTRSDRALGITQRDECIPVDDLPGFFTVRDTTTGSGKTYIASSTGCTCPDHHYRGHVCKHMRAVITEEYRLATYAADWDHACSTWATCCPECGAALETAVYWIGGRGYQSFLVCSAHIEHRARRV
jgi:hypothetical protein